MAHFTDLGVKEGMGVEGSCFFFLIAMQIENILQETVTMSRQLAAFSKSAVKKMLAERAAVDSATHQGYNRFSLHRLY